MELENDNLKVIMFTADEDIQQGRRVQLTKKNQIHHNWYFRLCIGILLQNVKKGGQAPVLVRTS